MPLDHYVSQVHLRNFYSPILGESLYGISKSNLKSFIAKAESICRTKDGNTNSYLTEERAIEEFLLTVEPKYNRALTQVSSSQINVETIYTLSGFVAYVSTCSPTAMRIHAVPLKQIVRTTANLLDKNNQLPKSPPTLGGKSLSELLADETVGIDVDLKYPQAVGIASILDLTATFGNFHWEFLHNPFSDSPFLTSDYPIAIEYVGEHLPVNRIVPLSPTIAARIIPNPALKRTHLDFSFEHFRWTSKTLRRNEIRRINTLIVQCAENNIFYQNNLKWIQPFIQRNRCFRIEAHMEELETTNGNFLGFQQRIVKYL